MESLKKQMLKMQEGLTNEIERIIKVNAEQNAEKDAKIKELECMAVV